MLSSKAANAVLVSDIGEKIPAYEEAYASTTSPNITGPSARSIFVVERVEAQDGFSGNEVHYGQKVRFVTNPYFHGKKLYLKSTAHSPLHHSKYSNY